MSLSFSAPGIPPVCQAIMPGILPAKAVVRSELDVFRSPGLTVVIAETTLSFFCVPKATTCTSSMLLESGLIKIFIILRLLIGFTTSTTSRYPRYENFSLSPALTFSEKRPSTSVAVPLSVPTIMTVTPGTSRPLSS